jgi:hypothetical protein
MNLSDSISERRKRTGGSPDPIMHLLWPVQRDYDIIDVPNDVIRVSFQK